MTIKKAEENPIQEDHHVSAIERDRRRAENDALRARTGDVELPDKLTSFLYDLLRDHLPAGTVESLVRGAQTTPIRYCNGHLARYAEDVAKRLVDK
jgi:hypothetical protein